MGEKLLPSDGKKATAASMKILISVVGFAEMITSTFIDGLGLKMFDKIPGESEEGDKSSVVNSGKLFEAAISMIFTLLDTGASYIFGYVCYSPMEPKAIDNEYAKQVLLVNPWRSCYTHGWHLKSILFIAMNLEKIYSAVKSTKSKAVIGMGGNSIALVLHIFSIVSECGAIYYANEVKTGNSFLDEESDKAIFICDTAGYIESDLKGILDSIYALGLKGVLKTNPMARVIYFAFREAFAGLYSSSMAISADYIIKG